MKRARLLRRIYLAAGIFSVISTALGLVGTAVFGLDKSYVLMAISMVFVFHGSYGAPFYFYHSARYLVLMRICDAITSGLTSYAEISEIAFVKAERIKPFVEKCINKKLVSGYEAADEGIISIK
jgi:hypothetical protein